jgi:hypothetical protein
MKQQKTKSTEKLAVADRHAASQVVLRLIAKLGGGIGTRGAGQREAARRLGVPMGTLVALRAGKRRWISSTTSRAISRAVNRIDDGDLSALHSKAFAPHSMYARLDDYKAWCLERATRLIRRDGLRWILVDGEPRRLPANARLQVEEGIALPEFSHLVQRYRAEEKVLLMNRIWDLPAANEEWDRLERMLVAMTGTEARRLVAQQRVLEPLLESAESGWIERDWREMGEIDLARFIHLGRMREKLLLEREVDHARAAKGPPSTPRSR